MMLTCSNPYRTAPIADPPVVAHVLATCPQVDWLRRRTRKVDISAAVRPKIVSRSHMTRPVRCPPTWGAFIERALSMWGSSLGSAW